MFKSFFLSHFILLHTMQGALLLSHVRISWKVSLRFEKKWVKDVSSTSGDSFYSSVY